MKKSGIVKTVIIVVLLAAIVLTFFLYQSHRSRQRQAQQADPVATVVQSVLMRDLEHNYPPTPKEVLKYYAEITECFYNESYTDDELLLLANKIQELYDAELVANKTKEQYIEDLKTDITKMKQDGYSIASYEVSASTDVEYFTQDGYSCARLYCTFYLRQAGSTGRAPSLERFLLRQDEDGHWKIMGWELVEDE
ncbi:MAG: hypothetical protein NC302_11745 [Bacteroidales bacterium]|nr:hypothetical protein [Bacteroidales bacterium]MCM1416544.1 hypothetical protein [bacterium]MCM1424857.1 hypothetical protein [bacterium]